MIPRILPFAAYMAFLAIGFGVSWLAGSGSGSASWGEAADLWLYPVKTAVVIGLLVFFWPQYRELKGRLVTDWREGLLAVGVGIGVYLAWVRMDWSWATQGAVGAYDPFKAGQGLGWILATIRIFGAAVVVPIMEELFWRSFLIRYVINSQFESVRIGTFTPVSFAAIVVLFGLEHNLWLAGMMAGAAYNLLLYRTGRVWPCILAHGATNLALGGHVLVTEEWQWW